MKTIVMFVAGYEIELYQSVVDPNKGQLTFTDNGGGEGEGCTLRINRDDAARIAVALNTFAQGDE